jgi:hypothetical protein
MQSCTEPAPTSGCLRWTQTAPTTLHTNQDCLDTSAGGSAHPGQTSYFTSTASGLSPSYDYDCSGTAVRDQGYSSSATSPPLFISSACTLMENRVTGLTYCSGATWYVASSAPACGSSATESYCALINLAGRYSCNRTSRTGQLVACH